MVSTASIATAVVCGVTAVATPAVADTWNVTSSNTYTNGKAKGTYEGNFYRPGWTGSAGFYDSIGATGALNILIGKDSANNSEYEKAQVNIGGAKDTTNLQNVKKALAVVRRTNELRKQEGRAELKLTHRLMAGAQWQGEQQPMLFSHVVNWWYLWHRQY